MCDGSLSEAQREAAVRDGSLSEAQREAAVWDRNLSRSTALSIRSAHDPQESLQIDWLHEVRVEPDALLWARS